MAIGNRTAVRALGGGPLAGEKIVRIAYIDEAGISKISQEPIVVVAAAIINPDQEYHVLRRYYRDLADDLFPNGENRAMIFHAKDVFHGSGEFPRKHWPLPERIKILERLAQVPALFDIPICLGAINKKAYISDRREKYPDASEKECLKWAHAVAFFLTLQAIDHWMETRAFGEVAMIIAEDTPKVKELLGYIHHGAQSDAKINEDVFTTRHIVDEINFVKKAHSELLQVADTVAFISRRGLGDCGICLPLARRFGKQIVDPPKPKKTSALKIPLSRLRRVEG